MSPEYAMQGLFSEKSDVFSFGVLLLEIISGRKNSSFGNQEEALSLLGYVSFVWFFLWVQFRTKNNGRIYLCFCLLRHGKYGMKMRLNL